MSIRRVTMHQSALRLAHAAERRGEATAIIDAPAPVAVPTRTRAKKAKRARRR